MPLSSIVTITLLLAGCFLTMDRTATATPKPEEKELVIKAKKAILNHKQDSVRFQSGVHLNYDDLTLQAEQLEIDHLHQLRRMRQMPNKQQPEQRQKHEPQRDLEQNGEATISASGDVRITTKGVIIETQQCRFSPSTNQMVLNKGSEIKHKHFQAAQVKSISYDRDADLILLKPEEGGKVRLKVHLK